MNANEGPGMHEGDGASDENDLLEARYRRALTLLPAGYREQRGEEMISTLLDGATEGRRWPSRGELASLAALGTRLRVGAPGGTPRAVATGEVLRRTALAGLLVMGLWHAAMAAGDLTLIASQRGRHMLYMSYSHWHLAFRSTLDFGRPLLYLGALVALVRGRRRLGRILGVAQLGLMAAVLACDKYTATSDQAALLAAALVVAIAVWLGFHRAAPRIATPRRWLLAVTGMTALVLIVFAAATAIGLGGQSRTAGAGLIDQIARVTAGPLIPGLAALFGLLRARRSPIWPAALLTLGLPGLILMPREVILFTQGKAGHLFYGDLFAGAPWPGMAAYMAITDTILAAALAWVLYRHRTRSTAIAA
ncbi:MAG TPA: hypothetical protein VFU74_04475 [Actinocrinis sp.]|nr:hypothetical protein [Actinocrinis sp.]